MITMWIQDLLGKVGVTGTLSLYLSMLIFLACLLIVSWIGNYVTKTYLCGIIRRIIQKTNAPWGEAFLRYRLFHRISHLAPAFIIYVLIPLILSPEFGPGPAFVRFIRVIMTIYMILALVQVFDSLSHSFEDIYNKKAKDASRRPIKSYLQVLKILIYLIAAIWVISAILDKSPWALFTGLGAMAAILMLVFKDSILGFVASVQLASYDMVRVGDWVVLPSYNANGDVTEISLNTVKVRNFDKTITTVPTSALLTTGVTNWRGMKEAGGRRIKRSINIDMTTIRFCDDNLLEKLGKVHLLKDYIEKKQMDISVYNKENKIDRSVKINGRTLTNIGLLRSYIEHYLQNHPQVHKDYTLLIRQLQPTSTGLPLELYIFTTDTLWKNYERIQADIFDHILAIIPEFDLAVFQEQSDHNYKKSMQNPNLGFSPS